MLRVKNVSKTFDGKRMVLKDASLDIQKGDFVSIMGASGSGKSTLLTIMGGIDKPTLGEVYLEGRCISNLPERELAILRRTKIGFVFQFFNLAPYLNVEENILLPIILDRKKAKDYKDKVAEIMEYLKIMPFRDTLPTKLSGGEQQRVAIAKGLITEPQIILLDEPTGNLDSASAEDIMHLLVKINTERHTTIVQVTHDEHNAAFASKIFHIKDGQIENNEHNT